MTYVSAMLQATMQNLIYQSRRMLHSPGVLTAACAALQVGCLMDRHNRVTLLMICVFVGEGPCLATYLVTKYWQLVLTRMLTGIAVGGALLCSPCKPVKRLPACLVLWRSDLHIAKCICTRAGQWAAWLVVIHSSS